MTEPWAEQTPYLLQLPGIGLITGMTTLRVGAIGEIERFPTAKKLVGDLRVIKNSQKELRLSFRQSMPAKSAKNQLT
ncbi:MAG: IS110 family transposase [Anaerolineales bacterium]|nr:IS110 family transposase [Anaerolineales bacterium]